MKRILSVMLALVLLLGVMPMSAMADDMITLKVGVYERGNTTNTYGTATDNYWTRWIQKEFGDPNNIKLEYIPIPRAEDTAKINTMMASGTAPDIIFSYDTNMILGYGRDGGLTDLGDLIEKYGPNIKENLKASLPYGMYKGTQYAIPALRSMIGRYTNFIRKDWLDAKGIELEVNENGYYHMSVEDYEKLVYDAKSWDIDGTGMEMYPVGLAGAHNATQTMPLIFAFVDKAKVTEEMVASTPQMLWPGFKDGVRFLNKLYNDKLIDPDFMVDTDTALPSLNAMVSTGRTLTMPQDDMYNTGIIALYETKPEAEFVGLQIDNIHGEQIINVYQPIGMFLAVPATCKNPEAAVKYIDFLADLDTYKVLAHGFEGIHYNMVDGEPKVISYTEEEIKNGEGDYLLGDVRILDVPYGPELGVQFTAPYPVCKDKAVFWQLNEPDTYIRPYMDAYFFGQWFYAIQVGMIGLYAAGKALGKNVYCRYFMDSISIMAEYFDYALWDAKRFKNPTLIPRACDLQELDPCGTIGVSMIEAYWRGGNAKHLRVIHHIENAMMNVIPRFEDGTFYRVKTMWADDLYMSCPYLIRMAALTSDEKYLDEVVRQIEGFHSRLFMADQKIYSHIYFPPIKTPNRIPWGRGNGWIAVTLTEVLTHMPAGDSRRAYVLERYRTFMQGIAAVQDKTGMWHQVLNEDFSYEETSATAMFTLAMARGVRNGWLDESYMAFIKKGWEALQRTSIDAEGNVYGVCLGSGCSLDSKYYREIPTHKNDDHGSGIILLLASELLEMNICANGT